MTFLSSAKEDFNLFSFSAGTDLATTEQVLKKSRPQRNPRRDSRLATSCYDSLATL
jgi:hypothetical protein